MESSIKAARGLLRLIDCDYSPSRVISIVSPSRSGSTIFKYAICKHPDLTGLAGEEEPYYKLARNGYPWHRSDEFHECNHPEQVRLLTANEVYNHEQHWNRGVLQTHSIEEPPFIRAIDCRITDTLVLKTPQNCYRRGVIEQLYPLADVSYIRIVRDPRATINGIMDGWESDDFKARLTPQGWWKFDMPPNWSFDATIFERSWNQYQMASAYLDRDYTDAYCVSFEEFEQDFQWVVRDVWKHLGLGGAMLPSRLPKMCITDQPTPNRWEKKRPWLKDMV